MREDIIERLEALDRLSHVDIVHILKRGTANVLFYDENVGLALEHDCGTVFSVPFRERGLETLYEAIGSRRLICVHSDVMYSHYLASGYRSNGPCYTFSYYGEKLSEGPYPFRQMRLSEIPFILKYYDSDEQSLEYDIERGNLFCIEENGVVMGFCGFHSEEAMGLLVILPEHRRKGLGTYMESHVINEALSRGWTPFCNVYSTNKASIALQQKLSLVAGKVLSYWVWTPKCE